eukprot:15324019-Alexandrium_andersonii.AAC.1
MVGVENGHQLTEGEAVEIHKRLVSVTARFVQDIGGRLSPEKCRTLSNRPKVRRHIRMWKVPELAAAIPACVSIRDLGAQLNTGAVAYSGVMRARCQRAAAVADHVASLPVSHSMKCSVAVGKSMPMAIYGCPCSPI